jgi:NADH dehydrogenase/putative oxidoreductase
MENRQAIGRTNRVRERLAAFGRAVRRTMRGALPVVDLVVRVSLARAFFDPGMLPPGPLLDVLRTGWAPIFAQVSGPVLFAAGLLLRPVAALMLVLTLLAEMHGAPRDEHLFWAALFGWYVVEAPGPLSLDRVLAHGLGISPLPFSAQATAVFAWTERHLAPLYRLAVRLWLAAAVAGAAAGLHATAMAMLPTMQSAPLPAPIRFGAAALLAAGLFTPVVALMLLVTGVGAVFAGVDGGATLYGSLLLALLAVSGAGRWSLDAALGWWLDRETPLPADAHHVVVVGAGFGGMACAAALRNVRARVTLIDRNNYHLFQPLLYQVATGSLSPADIATPIRSVFRGEARLRVLRGTVSGIDTAARTVCVDGGALGYDTLVIATGATHAYFGRDAWARHAPGLKSVRDATEIRSRILDAFERAEAAEDPALRERLLTFLICGAGPTGVELAGAIAELARHGLAREFRGFDPASARIVLVQAGPRILPQFPETLARVAHGSLGRLGVEVRTNSRVEEIDAGGAVVNGMRVEAGTVLWTAGVAASPAADWLGVAPDRAGRVPVGPDLTVPGRPEVFVIGDTALSLAWNGEPAPGLAPAAKQAGSYAASVIAARLAGRMPPRPFRYKHKGSLATIGRKSAVADFGRLRLAGPIAWWLWGAVHILFLAGFRNRVAVVVGWVWSYFTFDVAVRLITQPQPPSAESAD